MASEEEYRPLHQPRWKNWSKPEIVLSPLEGSDWEADMNRPVVVYKDGQYHMWYTGQNNGNHGLDMPSVRTDAILNVKARTPYYRLKNLGKSSSDVPTRNLGSKREYLQDVVFRRRAV